MMQRVRSDAVIARSAALDYRKDHWRIASGATGTMSWRVVLELSLILLEKAKGNQ
jgi:hypothetical protein